MRSKDAVKVEIDTYGCSMNKAASEAMSGLLAGKGFILGPDGDVLVLNTCTVKTPTERKIVKRLHSLEKEGRQIVVVGCLPAAWPEMAEEFPDYSFLGTNVLDLEHAVREASAGRRFVKIENRGGCLADVPKIRENRFVGIVPVSVGCLGDCSYCIVKHARGRLNSFPEEKIIGEVRNAVNDGVLEIWLTSQDTGAYGLDKGMRLPDLLNKVSAIDGGHMIRVGMMNPDHVLLFLDELINAYKSERVYKFLHVPVQSGDDHVLASMNRRYKVEDYKKIVSEFRKEIPDITLSTDIIAGYPTEDENAFQRSLDLVKEVKPDVVNVSRFWPRPHTKAEGITPLAGRTTNDRSRRLVSLFRELSLEKNKAWIGWKGPVHVTEKVRDRCFSARNYAYKPVVIDSVEDLLGKTVDAEITDANHFVLKAKAA